MSQGRPRYARHLSPVHPDWILEFNDAGYDALPDPAEKL